MRVHKRFLGDRTAAGRLWPFARKKLAEVEALLRQSGGNAFTKTVALAEGWIRIQVVGGDAHVTIHIEGGTLTPHGVLVTPRVGPIAWWDWYETYDATHDTYLNPEYLRGRFHPFIDHLGYRQPAQKLESGAYGGAESTAARMAPSTAGTALVWSADAMPTGISGMLRFMPNKRLAFLGSKAPGADPYLAPDDPPKDPFLDLDPRPNVEIEDWRSDDGIALTYNGSSRRRWSGNRLHSGWVAWARIYYRGTHLHNTPGACVGIATTRRTRDDGDTEHWLVAAIDRPYGWDGNAIWRSDSSANAIELWARPIERRIETAAEARVREQANAKREALGLLPLYIPPGTKANPAREYANRMVREGFFAHDGQAGDRLGELGDIWWWAENLTMSVDAASADEAFQNWMDSPPHRDSILRPDNERMDMEMYVGVSDEPDYRGRYYWVMYIVRWGWSPSEGGYFPHGGVHDRHAWKRLGPKLPRSYGIPVIRADGRQVYLNSVGSLEAFQWVADIDLSDPAAPTYHLSQHQDPLRTKGWDLAAYDYRGGAIVNAWQPTYDDDGNPVPGVAEVRIGTPVGDPEGGHVVSFGDYNTNLMHLDLRHDLVLWRYEGVGGVVYRLHYQGVTEALYQSGATHHATDNLFKAFDNQYVPETGHGVAVDGRGRLFLSLFCTDYPYMAAPHTWEKANAADLSVVNLMGEADPQNFTRTPAGEAYTLVPLGVYALQEADPISWVVPEGTTRRVPPGIPEV